MQTKRTDILVLGSGVAGLTAALIASICGLRTVVLEQMDRIGGTSARSSGTVWIPGNHHLDAASDDCAHARQYLGSLVAGRGPEEMWQTFLENGPAMLAELEQAAGIEFRPYVTAPDYRQDHPGAASGGRALEPLAFDGRLLGDDFARLGEPIPELTLFGGMMITRAEAASLVHFDQSPPAMSLGARMVIRYLRDRLRHKRGTRLVLGNALVARLLKAALDRGVSVLCNARVTELVKHEGRVAGAIAEVGGQQIRFECDSGVILAGGGFPANAQMRARHLPKPVATHTPAAPGCDGSTIELGIASGASLGPDGLDNAQWFPSSLALRKDGSTAVYPHIVLDRAKPGVIAVDQNGRRFVNEAASYHEFVRGMYAANGEGRAIPSWLICDRAAIRKYGLGLIRPRWTRLGRYIDSGYLIEAASIVELASRLGIPADELCATIERFNRFAIAGSDDDFDRGKTIYDRNNGDPAHKPNPALGALEHGPFYAVALHPTPLGTSRGLKANIHAQACDADGRPIDGLYVCGNDMQSAFGGEYPGAGGQLGQAMTFAWIAAHHAATQNSRRLPAHANEQGRVN